MLYILELFDARLEMNIQTGAQYHCIYCVLCLQRGEILEVCNNRGGSYPLSNLYHDVWLLHILIWDFIITLVELVAKNP